MFGCFERKDKLIILSEQLLSNFRVLVADSAGFLSDRCDSRLALTEIVDDVYKFVYSGNNITRFCYRARCQRQTTVLSVAGACSALIATTRSLDYVVIRSRSDRTL